MFCMWSPWMHVITVDVKDKLLSHTFQPETIFNSHVSLKYQKSCDVVWEEKTVEAMNDKTMMLSLKWTPVD